MRGKWLWRFAQLVVLAVVGYFMYRRLAPELDQIEVDRLTSYDPAAGLLIGSMLLLMIVYLMHAALWRHIAHVLGGPRLPIRDAIRIYFLSGLGRYLPGKFWQIAGLAVLAQRAGLSPLAATAASVVGHLAFILTGLVLFAVLLPGEYGAPAALTAFLLLVAGAVLYLLGNTASGRNLRHRVLRRLGPRVGEAGALLDRISGKSSIAWTAAYGVSWLLLGGAFALFVIAFDLAYSRHALHFMATVAASYLFGYIMFTPGGLGFREASMVALLSLVIPAEPALVIAVASRFWFTVGELAPLALVPLLPRGSEAAV